MLCEAISTHCAQENSERPLEHTKVPQNTNMNGLPYQLMMASQPTLPQHTPQPPPKKILIFPIKDLFN